NYSFNSKGAKADLLVQPNCPDFPDTLWIDVLLNHYIDLDKIYTAYSTLMPEYKQTETIGDFEIVVHSSGTNKNAKTIKTHGEWTIAFDALKRAVLYAYPHRVDELAQYERFIIGQFHAIHNVALHSRIIHLDQAIRGRVSRSNTLFFTFDQFNDLVTEYILTPATDDIS
ncbi:hypothetical protein K439DRAFT_1331586, partial [Ramaria rubella]